MILMNALIFPLLFFFFCNFTTKYLGEFKFYQVFFTVSKQIIKSALCEAARTVSGLSLILLQIIIIYLF